MIIQITNEKQIDELVKSGHIGKGTATTGKFGLKQGKPVYVAFPED